MATSGTVGLTAIDTAKVLEHALRRVRVHPTRQTPEIIEMAKENLYLLLLNLSNRGLNLWCIQTDLIGLERGKPTYQLPIGTLDITNLVYCQPSRVSGTNTITSTGVVTDLNSAVEVRRIGLKFSSITASDTVTISVSDDNVNFRIVKNISSNNWTVGVWYWYDLDILTSARYFKAETTTNCSVSEFYLANVVVDLPLSQWNRDTWAVINNKMQLGRPSTNYYLERLITPQVTLWPVPNNNYDHLQAFVQRQVQDVGTLSQQIEVPQRWVESIIWQLALRLAFEIPDVEPQVIQLVSAMADRTMLEVEHDESDGAPLMLQPNVGVYTR